MPVSTLKDILCTPENRPRVVADAARLVDDEVNAKSGLSGKFVQVTYKGVKTVKPGLIPEVVDHLLEKFVEAMEPFYQEWLTAGRQPAFDAFLTARSHKVANALLAVTDARARQVANKTIKKGYEALRPQGEKHVEAAVPGLGRTFNKYLG